MKKILLGLAFLSITALQAQEVNSKAVEPVQKGNWMVGASLGSLGYAFESEQFNINLAPQAGYFVQDNLALGLKLGLGWVTVKNADNFFTYELSPFVRYYFPNAAAGNGRFFLQGDIGVTGTSAANTDAALKVGANVGYAHFLNRNVAVEVTAGYNYSESNFPGADSQSGLGVAAGFQIYLPGRSTK